MPGPVFAKDGERPKDLPHDSSMSVDSAHRFALTPIGVIRTPFADPKGVPIQPRFAGQAEGRIQVDPEYQHALADLDGFERVWLLYWFHRSDGWTSPVTPFLDDTPRGLFATRAPRRPNALGMSCVPVLAVERWGLRVGAIDIVDGAPLLDIKPYVPKFDAFASSKAGWLDGDGTGREVADDRFATND